MKKIKPMSMVEVIYRDYFDWGRQCDHHLSAIMRKHRSILNLVLSALFILSISACQSVKHKTYIHSQGVVKINDISKNTNKIVEKMAEINVVMGSAVGFAAVRTNQYDNFIELKNEATTEELIKLTNHPNATVRAYSFWALSDKHFVDLFPIVLNHIDDNEIIETRFGCIGYSEAVGDFFIGLISSKLNSIQSATLDHALIYTTNDLHAKKKSINKSEITESLYPRIRELVIKEKSLDALVVLAKHQNNQDVDLIVENLNRNEVNPWEQIYTYKAVSQYPHPDFFPFLKKDLKNALGSSYPDEYMAALYVAIASYKNNESVELLHVPLMLLNPRDRKQHVAFVFAALNKRQDPIYNELLWVLGRNKNIISSDVFKYLFEKYPKNIYEMLETILTNMEYIYNDDTVNIIDDVFEKAFYQDEESVIKIIRKKIMNAKYYLFMILAGKAIGSQDKSLVKPFLERFELENDFRICLKIVETLTSYEDLGINKQMRIIKNNKKGLEKWQKMKLDKLLNRMR